MWACCRWVSLGTAAHSSVPFQGLSVLQSPIRKQKPIPIHKPVPLLVNVDTSLPTCSPADRSFISSPLNRDHLATQLHLHGSLLNQVLILRLTLDHGASLLLALSTSLPCRTLLPPKHLIIARKMLLQRSRDAGGHMAEGVH